MLAMFNTFHFKTFNNISSYNLFECTKFKRLFKHTQKHKLRMKKSMVTCRALFTRSNMKTTKQFPIHGL